jgi:hypothetical protein
LQPKKSATTIWRHHLEPPLQHPGATTVREPLSSHAHAAPGRAPHASPAATGRRRSNTTSAQGHQPSIPLLAAASHAALPWPAAVSRHPSQPRRNAGLGMGTQNPSSDLSSSTSHAPAPSLPTQPMEATEPPPAATVRTTASKLEDEWAPPLPLEQGAAATATNTGGSRRRHQRLRWQDDFR